LSEIYFDNSSTTKVCREAADKVMELMTENYGNPSSLHSMGFRAERELTTARSTVAQQIGARDEEIFFTSGGTESNNLALFGAAHARRKRGNRIVSTEIEHHSVLNTLQELEREGFEVVLLKPDHTGNIPEEAIREAITPDTILVSMMCVNNEVGSILPIQVVPQAIQAAGAPALFHVDAVQAFGKLPLRPEKSKIDLMSMSAHKIHGPKGVGALYVRKGVHINPHSFGGGQESNIRPGTEALELIAGFAEAVRQLPETEQELARMRKLNHYCRERLSELDGAIIHSTEQGLPYILSFAAGKVRSETLLHYLSEHEIYVSSGSACSKGKPSHVLAAMNLPRDVIDSTLRLSFSRYNTEEEVDRFVEVLKQALSTLTKRA